MKTKLTLAIGSILLIACGAMLSTPVAEALNKLTTIEVANWLGQAAPPVSVAGNATVYFNSSTNKLMVSQNGSAYASVTASAGGSQTPWVQNIDAAGYTLTNLGGIYDSTPKKSADTNIRNLFASDGTTVLLDWGSSKLLDSGGKDSIDWANRLLGTTFAGLQVYSVDWANRTLLTDLNYTSLDWANFQAFDNTGFPDVLSIDWNTRTLIDSGGVSVSVDWGARSLSNSSSLVTVDWEGQRLERTTVYAGSTSMDWNQSFLYAYLANEVVVMDWFNCDTFDLGGVNRSINWDRRELVSNDGSTIVLDWSDPEKKVLQAVSSDSTGNTTPSSSVVAVTAPNDATSHTYSVGGYVTVTAISVNTITLQVDYTDETSASRTASFFGQGLTTAAISTTGASGFPPITIRAKFNTSITVKTTVVGVGSQTYDVGGYITQIN